MRRTLKIAETGDIEPFFFVITGNDDRGTRHQHLVLPIAGCLVLRIVTACCYLLAADRLLSYVPSLSNRPLAHPAMNEA